MENENCLYCGLPANHSKHNRKEPHKDGWHVFRGLDYLKGLEDGLLFVRENHQLHIVTYEPNTDMDIDVGDVYQSEYLVKIQADADCALSGLGIDDITFATDWLVHDIEFVTEVKKFNINNHVLTMDIAFAESNQ